MKREILFQMKSAYRDDFRITGFRFGEGTPTLAIVGSMRGDEIQQQYICAQIVSVLKRLEERGEMDRDKSVLVIPSCNPFSMNVNKRFWAMDGTDINRMYPGYDKGETTQRIAAAVFKQLEGFQYGIQMSSFYMSGDFVPHVRMLRTGFEDVDSAKLFGMPLVTVHTPLPFDTTLLNYNWQLWNTKAFSVYAGQTNSMDFEASQFTIDSIIRFMKRTGIIKGRILNVGYESVYLNEDELVNVSAKCAGIFCRVLGPNQHVRPGTVLAKIVDPYDGSVLEEVKSPVHGMVFFVHNKPLVLQNSLIYKIQSFDNYEY